MNILFLTIGTLNDIEERGLYTDLIRKFRDEGHNVFVANPREKRLNQETALIKEKDVTFLRVKVGNLTKTNLIEKGIATLRIEGQFLKAIQKYFSDIKFDLVLYSTPPITFEKVITYIKKRDQAKSYLLLKDIFPQNAVDLGMFSEKSIFNKYFTFKEKKLYSNSDYIGCMSPANVKFVVQSNPEIDANIVEVCPNSIEPMSVQIDDSAKIAIREKYDIPVDKTVFIYGGNLGKPQGIDFLIDCLKGNVTDQDIYFVIAGSGTEYKKLTSFFETEKPKNAQLFSQLPKNEYELLANSCDVGMIFLDNRFTIPNFPSRLLSYMQASMPVLAATDVNTDIGIIIEEGQFGYWCESRQVEDFNERLKMFKDQHLRQQMGENARKYLDENYTVQHSYDIIMKHFKIK